MTDPKTTPTGRIATNEPNIQNIPIHTPEGTAIRAAFEGQRKPHIDPGPCGCCGRSEPDVTILGVASSGMLPMSILWCLECLEKPAEPEIAFINLAYTIWDDTKKAADDDRLEAAEGMKDLWTWRDGAYINWPEWNKKYAAGEIEKMEIGIAEYNKSHDGTIER